MFKRLFAALTGKSTPSAAPAPAAPLQTAAPADEQLITAYDAYGRELKITRTEWREKMFLPQLQQKWDQPGELYSLIVSGLNDDFAADLLPAAARLVEIDDIPERGHTMHGIVLMKNGQLDAAEATLRQGMAKVGETGTLLTNLAKVFAERDDQAQADTTLWRAVQQDPNMENGLMWWLAIQQERGGQDAYLQGLRAVAALPGSWRAQLWLARHDLETGNVAAAQAQYAKVLAQGSYDHSALMMISGDLGNNGQIPLMVELLAPVFDEHQHDPMAGLNLLRAYQELGQVAAGEALLNRMYALNYPHIKQYLDQFAQAFQALHQQNTPATPLDPDQLQITTCALNQPIWQYGLCNADWLFAQKPAEAAEVGIFAFSKLSDGSERAEAQREDDIGRYTRAIPLYLAEAVHYWSDYAATTYVLVVEGGGPVLTSATSDGATLFDIVPAKTQYLVTGEVGCSGEGETAVWQVILHLWSRGQKAEIASQSGSATGKEIGQLVLDLESSLLAHIGQRRAEALDEFYVQPSAEAMPIYLTELAQSFMFTLVANDPGMKSSLWGERAMLDWPLRMALHWPTVEVPTLMYLSCLGKAFDYRSDVLPEYKERTLDLLRQTQSEDHPLAPLVWKVFGMEAELEAYRQAQAANADPSWLAWLDRVGDLQPSA